MASPNLEPARPPSKVVAVANPEANQGRAKKVWDALLPKLSQIYPQFELQWTQSKGHGRVLSQHALQDGADLVLAMGGDGTVNEVLCGFVDDAGRNRFPGAVLGVMAGGSGSDFQRMFGKVTPSGLPAALEAAEPTRIDYGLASFVAEGGAREIRPFLNVASAGISGEVVRELEQQDSELGPTLRYLKATLVSIARLQNTQAMIELDDDRAQSQRLDLTLACVANGRFFGSGMEISPQSAVDDGHFRVLLASVPTRLALLAIFSRVYRAKHLKAKGVQYHQASRVQLRPVDLERRISLELDGELVGKLPGEFEIVRGGIWVRAPGLTPDLNAQRPRANP